MTLAAAYCTCNEGGTRRRPTPAGRMRHRPPTCKRGPVLHPASSVATLHVVIVNATTGTGSEALSPVVINRAQTHRPTGSLHTASAVPLDHRATNG
jgi:hypothetical protein